jgi:hypothetical protein
MNARAIIEAESPHEFLRHARRKAEKAAAAKRARVRSHLKPRECHDWLEWPDLEDWQREAMVEFQREEGYGIFLDHGTQWMGVETDRGMFTLYESNTAAFALAVEEVEERISDDVADFDQDFLAGFIDAELLLDRLIPDWVPEVKLQYDEEYPTMEEKRDLVIEAGMLDPEDFEEGEAIPDGAVMSAYDRFIEDKAAEDLSDPVSFLLEQYGTIGGIRHALALSVLDVVGAAETLVEEKGWQHYLAREEGASRDLPSGAVYVRGYEE